MDDIEKENHRRVNALMATEEHKRLADIVKGTHALLRAECHQYGAEVAWERHMARNDILQVRLCAAYKIKFYICQMNFKFYRSIYERYFTQYLIAIPELRYVYAEIGHYVLGGQ